MLQDRGSVSDSGKLDVFGFYAMTVPTTRPRHKERNLCKISPYTVDKFGSCKASAVCNCVSVSVPRWLQTGWCSCGPKKPRMVTSLALLDTGAQMVVSGMDLVHKLGVTRKELLPMTSGINAANSEGLKLVCHQV